MSTLSSVPTLVDLTVARLSYTQLLKYPSITGPMADSDCWEKRTAIDRAMVNQCYAEYIGVDGTGLIDTVMYDDPDTGESYQFTHPFIKGIHSDMLIALTQFSYNAIKVLLPLVIHRWFRFYPEDDPSDGMQVARRLASLYGYDCSNAPRGRDASYVASVMLNDMIQDLGLDE